MKKKIKHYKVTGFEGIQAIYTGLHCRSGPPCKDYYYKKIRDCGKRTHLPSIITEFFLKRNKSGYDFKEISKKEAFIELL